MLCTTYYEFTLNVSHQSQEALNILCKLRFINGDWRDGLVKGIGCTLDTLGSVSSNHTVVHNNLDPMPSSGVSEDRYSVLI